MSTEKIISTDQNLEDKPYAVVIPVADGVTEAYACDDASDVINFIAEGDYKGLDDTDALATRVALAATLRDTVQAAVLDGYLGEGGEVDGDVVDALMAAGDAAVLAGVEWPGDRPPAVVEEAAFAPHSNHPAPTGNVVFFRALDELDFISDLAAFGLLDVRFKDSGAVNA